MLLGVDGDSGTVTRRVPVSEAERQSGRRVDVESWVGVRARVASLAPSAWTQAFPSADARFGFLTPHTRICNMHVFVVRIS